MSYARAHETLGTPRSNAANAHKQDSLTRNGRHSLRTYKQLSPLENLFLAHSNILFLSGQTIFYNYPLAHKMLF